MQLFINYAPADVEQLYPLIELLGESDHTLDFIHDYDEENWETELVERITAADAMLYFFTNESVNHPWCKWAFTAAIHASRPVIPVVGEGGVVLPMPLRGRPVIDISRGIRPLVRGRLVSDLSQYMYMTPPEIFKMAPVPDAPPVYPPFTP
jgi:hypothetical protein